MTPALWATGSGGRSYLPYAFTEQGIYMLTTVLKGDSATKQSIALTDALESMIYESLGRVSYSTSTLRGFAGIRQGRLASK